jgi:hypothetical protein
LGIIAQGPPDFDQTLRQGIVHNCRIWPDCTGDLSFVHQTAVVLNKVDEDFERLATECHLFGAAT